MPDDQVNYRWDIPHGGWAHEHRDIKHIILSHIIEPGCTLSSPEGLVNGCYQIAISFGPQHTGIIFPPEADVYDAYRQLLLAMAPVPRNLPPCGKIIALAPAATIDVLSARRTPASRACGTVKFLCACRDYPHPMKYTLQGISP